MTPALPLLDIRELVKSYGGTRKIQWKRQAGEICECSVNAGLV